VAYNQAAVYQTMGRYDDATKLLQDLLKKTEKPQGSYSPSDRENRSIFFQRLGTVYRDQGNYPASVEAFRGMLTLGDENAKTGYQEVIDTYREARDWTKATTTAKEAVEKLPNDRDMRIVYASQLADSGQPDQAIAEVRAELKGTPEDRMIYIALSQMNTRLKRWSDSEEALNKAEALSTKPDEKQYIQFLRGSAYEREKKYDEAEAEFKKVLAADPNNAVTLNYLGYMNADRGVRLDEALNFIKLAVQVEPANSAYLDSLGWAYYRLGKYDLAETNLVKASEHMGSDPTVQEHLGDLYQKTGRLKLAITHWERALDGWNKTVAADVDTDEVAKTQKNLDAAKVRVAKDQGAKE
jgi:tetratricopeptide (TPR) repeat protein